MIRHPYTLYHVARELGELLRGARIIECYVHNDETVVLHFEGQTSEIDVEVHCTEPIVGISARAHRGRPRHRTHDLFPLLRSARITSIEQPRTDRVLIVHTTTVNLEIRLFSGGKVNLFAVGDDNIVLDCFRDRPKYLMQPLPTETGGMRSLQQIPPNSTVMDALAKSNLALGSLYAAEVCHRANINGETMWHGVDAQTRQHIENIAHHLKQQCIDQPSFQLVRMGAGDLMLTLCPLQGSTPLAQTYTSVFAAIEELLRTRFRERRTARARQRLRQHVQRELARTEKALLEIRQYISGANKATLLRYKADLLLSTPDVHHSGSDRVVLTGWSGEDVVITLDEHLTLAENATQYYQRARRAEAAARMAAERAPKLEARCTELHRMQEIVSEELSYSELQELMKKEHLDDATERGTHQSQKQSVSKYREFDLSEGWTLYVGRSAQNNDELTMKFAKQKDTWLHARGVSGSHAVLRSAQSIKPPKNILEKAAAIVAYYSKARNAKYTPVVYTQRNNVRKPKGSAVGAVVLDREETIMIQPGLPAEYKSLDD